VNKVGNGKAEKITLERIKRKRNEVKERREVN
jgi:hypothetical protein